MSEKLASAEIDESRKRFEKHGIGKQWNLERRPDGRYGNVFTAFRWHDWQIAWQAAERDTGERCAQLLHERAGELELASPMKTMTTTSAELRELADRIRGVNR